MEGCLGLIESIHDRLKHISIIQVEIARSIIPQKSANNFQSVESKNSKLTRRDYLLKQAQLTASWIEDFQIRNIQPTEGDGFGGIPRSTSRNINNRRMSTNNIQMISLGEMPETVRNFEKFHQQMQNEYKHELPTTLKKWKQQQSFRSHANSMQKHNMSIT